MRHELFDPPSYLEIHSERTKLCTYINVQKIITVPSSLMGNDHTILTTTHGKNYGL